MARYHGSCHCGALGWRFETERSPAAWSVRACQCGFCRSHGARCTSDPKGAVTFELARPAALLRYRFALGTADFLVCRHCGSYLGAMIEVDGARYATVNTNVLDPYPEDLAAAEQASYDGETVAARIARRKAKWTPASGLPQT